MPTVNDGAMDIQSVAGHQLVERLRLWKVLDPTSDVDDLPEGA